MLKEKRARTSSLQVEGLLMVVLGFCICAMLKKQLSDICMSLARCKGLKAARDGRMVGGGKGLSEERLMHRAAMFLR